MFIYPRLFFTLWFELPMQLLAELWASAASASQESKTGHLRLWHTPRRIQLMRELINGIQKGDSPGEYVGPPITTISAHHGATISDDRNPHHVGDETFPPFNEHIVHGVLPFTEAMTAFWLFLIAHDTAVKPKGVKIDFLQPVFLRGKPLRYDIYPPEIEDPSQYVIKAYADDNTIDDTKPIVIMRIYVEDGVMSRSELEYHLYCGWLVSSLLAKKWPKCLFYQLTLSFGEAAPKEESTTAHVRVTADYQNKKGHQHIIAEVATGVGTSGETHIVLVPPAEATVVTEKVATIQPRFRLVA